MPVSNCAAMASRQRPPGMIETAMTTNDRRTFLRLMGAAAATAATLPESIGRALAIPANNRTGTIDDVEHIIVLMQENRSFDHYFGTLRGVRGFSDPHPVTLPSGKSVWHQPNGSSEVLPFHPTANNLGAAVPGRSRRMTGTAPTPRGTRAITINGSRTRAPFPWRICSGRIFRSTTRWPTLSPSATPIIARSSDRQIRTATTCGRAMSAMTASAAAP